MNVIELFFGNKEHGSIKMVLNMLILNLPSDTIGDEMYELLTMANQTTEDVFLSLIHI